jgi:hypothetical protein
MAHTPWSSWSFQGKTRTAEDIKVRSSMKCSLPIKSLVFANCLVEELYAAREYGDHPCMQSNLLALARNAAAWQII